MNPMNLTMTRVAVLVTIQVVVDGRARRLVGNGVNSLARARDLGSGVISAAAGAVEESTASVMKVGVVMLHLRTCPGVVRTSPILRHRQAFTALMFKGSLTCSMRGTETVWTAI